MSDQYQTSMITTLAEHNVLMATVLLPGVRVWNNYSKKLHMGDGATLGGVQLASLDTFARTIPFVNRAFPAAPTATVSADAGNVNGATSYRCTYLMVDGTETDGGVVSATVNPVNKKVDLTNIPIALLDSRVIGRAIFRTPAGDVTQVRHKLVVAIMDNSTTTYTDNVADGDLGRRCPYVNTSGGVATLNGLSYFAGGYSTRFGVESMPNNTNYAVTAYGRYSAQVATSLSRSEAIGVDSLQNIVTGEGITAVGTHAGGALTDGLNSVLMGYGALETALYATGCVVIGTKAMSSAQTAAAVNTTAVGAQCGQSVTTGPNNTMIGALTGQNITTGQGNVLAGVSSGQNIAAGNFNALFGHNVGTSLTGSTNVGMGVFALQNGTTAQDNVAVGAFAGTKITTGVGNTFFGRGAGDNVAQKVDASQSIAIGYGAYTTADNQCVIGDANLVSLTTAAVPTFLNGTAVPAGGTTGSGIKMSSTANLGVFFGSGAPTLNAAKGSLYLRTDGNAVNNRMYVNTDGAATWTSVTTAA